MRKYLAPLFLGILLSPSYGSAEPDPTLDFLYINSTAGEAAGGHAALRMDGTVFHYQLFPDGLFLMAKEPWSDFRALYNDLGNRSIRIARLPLDEKPYYKIRNHLLARYLVQERHLSFLDSLAGERRLLEDLARGPGTVAIRGLGLFSATVTNDREALSLKRRLTRRLGPGYLAGELEKAQRKIERTRPDSSAPLPAVRKMEAPDTAPAGWAVRLVEFLSLREGLKVLLEGRPLAPGSLLRPEDNGGPLTDGEREALAEYGGEIEDSIARLLRSPRPDRGAALLLQTARFQAVRQSLALGVLATLDPLAETAETDPPVEAAGTDPGAQGLASAARRSVSAYREAFVERSGQRDIPYALLEANQGRLFEIERSIRERTPPRPGRVPPGPHRSREVPIDWPAGETMLARAVERARAKEESFRDRLRDYYDFNLFNRNCVTLLVDSVNSSFEGRESARRSLRGYLEPGDDFSFIPFRFYQVVQKAFPVEDTQELPSYRLRWLAGQYERKGRLAWLRESNTLTSPVYEPWEEDAVFLFFTDDTVWPRPLLGAMNLVYATVHTAGGLLALPYDRGRHLKRSLEGVLYSVPELAFINIRKGSFPSLDPNHALTGNSREGKGHPEKKERR